MKTITTTALLELVEKMRYAQNSFFEAKTKEAKREWFEKSRVVEREIDEIIKGWRKQQRVKTVQGQLFKTPPSVATHS